MESKPTGILVKLRNSYGTLILIVLLVVIMSSFLLRRVNSLHELELKLLQLDNSFSELKEQVNTLLVPSELDEVLFISKEQYKNQFIEPKKERAEALGRELSELFLTSSVQVDLGEFNEIVEAYYMVVDSLVELSSRRGFKDYGLIGEMRQEAHFIEDSISNISTADILMLRRHEKDFLLRGDTAYITKFENKSESILAGLDTNDVAQERIENYKKAFIHLAEIELQIGNSTNPGIRRQLYRLNDQLNIVFAKLRMDVSNKINDILFNIYLLFGLSLLLAVFIAIFLSYRLGRSIGDPVKNLSSEIRRIELEDIKKGKKISIQSEIREVGLLVESFNTLSTLLRKQFLMVQKKNDELVTSNKLLQSSQLQLRKSNAVKDKLFSIISHDLRGPIGGMMVYLESLRDDVDDMDKEELKSFAAGMLTSATHLTNLLENLLEWSKNQMGLHQPKMVEVSIKASVERAKLLYSDRIISKQIEFVSTVSASHKAIADQGMTDFIIRNLISNAIKFTKPGGLISVDSKIFHKEIAVSVKDTGVGMSETDLSSIKHSKELITKRGTSNEKGTGLGLHLIKEFVAKNRGEFNILSKEGEGTEVVFTLRTE